MKVILLSRWFDLSLKVAIRKGSESKFAQLLDIDAWCDGNRAISAINSDLEFYFQGYDPTFITRYTAKRIATFFGSDDTNYFSDVVYAHR